MTTITVALAVAAMWTVGASAQSTQDKQIERVRVQIQDMQRIVISQEVLAEIRRIVDTAVGQGVAQDISREISRSMHEISREVAANAARVRNEAVSVVQNKDFTVVQMDRATKTLAIGEAGELVLKNVVGDITVKAGSGREATVEIVRVSRGKTEADAKLGLERVTAEVSVRGERGSVIAQYGDDRRPNYSVAVNYTVTTPVGTRLTVDTITGGIKVSGLHGDLSTSGVSGSVDISSCTHVISAKTIAGALTLTDVQSAGKLDVGGVSATVRLSGVKAQRLGVNVISGTISAKDVQAEAVTMGSISGDIDFAGTLAPKGRYEFQAHSGNVRLGITGGFDLEMRTFSGQVSADQSVGLTTTVKAGGPAVRSLKGVVGGGGAAVVATTFSGNVWVGKTLK
jgi:DUF4097 and DUF4098 domain-containing protein YvlB